jgi:hypothetical protein
VLVGAIIGEHPEIDVTLSISPTTGHTSKHEYALDWPEFVVDAIKCRTDRRVKLRLWNPQDRVIGLRHTAAVDADKSAVAICLDYDHRVRLKYIDGPLH